MKADMDGKISNISDFPFTNSSPQQAATKKIPESTEAEMDAFYAELSKCDIKPIALGLIPEYADSFVRKSRRIPTIFDNFNQKYLGHWGVLADFDVVTKLRLLSHHARIAMGTRLEIPIQDGSQLCKQCDGQGNIE